MRQENPPMAMPANIAARISRAAVSAAMTTIAATIPQRLGLLATSPARGVFPARAVSTPPHRAAMRAEPMALLLPAALAQSEPQHRLLAKPHREKHALQ